MRPNLNNIQGGSKAKGSDRHMPTINAIIPALARTAVNLDIVFAVLSAFSRPDDGDDPETTLEAAVASDVEEEEEKEDVTGGSNNFDLLVFVVKNEVLDVEVLEAVEA